MTGGYTTEDLVVKESVNTGKLDSKTGKEIIQTRFVLKYPETVIPVETSTEAASEEHNEVSEETEEEVGEMPEELLKEQAETQEMVENVDPFESANDNPFGEL
jgi:microcompartment protein CcmL/EutN